MFSVSSHAKHSDSVLNLHPAFAALVSWRRHSHHSVCTIKARRMSTRNHDSIPGIDQANWTGIAVHIWAILRILIVSHWHFIIGIIIDVVVVFDIVVTVIGVVVAVITHLPRQFSTEGLQWYFRPQAVTCISTEVWITYFRLWAALLLFDRGTYSTFSIVGYTDIFDRRLQSTFSTQGCNEHLSIQGCNVHFRLGAAFANSTVFMSPSVRK